MAGFLARFPEVFGLTSGGGVVKQSGKRGPRKGISEAGLSTKPWQDVDA